MSSLCKSKAWRVLFCGVGLFAAGLLAVCSTGREASEQGASAPHPYLRTCMEMDYPALLLKVEEGVQPRVLPREDDLDPVYLLSCRVLVSHKMAPQPGESVELLVPDYQAGAPSKDEHSPFWLVAGPEPEPPVRLAGDASVWSVSAVEFYGWSGDILKQAPEQLQGVWKEMADCVTQENE